MSDFEAGLIYLDGTMSNAITLLNAADSEIEGGNHLKVSHSILGKLTSVNLREVWPSSPWFYASSGLKVE